MKAENPQTRRKPTPLPAVPGDPGVWNDLERAAWRLPKPMLPSAWAEKHRRLYKSNIPGPYRNDNAPYLRGIMDIPTRPGCVQANIQKAAQIGVSEAARNLMGFWAYMEPDPVGLTLPDRNQGRKIVKGEIMPLFKRTGVLMKLLDRPARDALIERISLANGFLLDLMWSGSASSTASNPYRRVINDEVDKFEQWAGDEPDPIGRTGKRMRTYGDRRLQINISTPTTTNGQIHLLVEASTVKLYFFVPCPHCGRFQRLVFPQLKWADYDVAGKNELADRVVADGAAWYECAHCGEKITEEKKPAVVRRGRWSTEAGYVVDFYGKRHKGAEKVKRWPTGTRIGFQISGLYCLWEKWADVAAEFLRAAGSLEKSFHFRTETLGVPFEFKASRVATNVFSEKSKRSDSPAGIVPEWAWILLATIDTQADHFYAVVRAWGAGMKSQRVWHGKLMTFKELDKLIFATNWPVAGGQWPAMTPSLALIDSGGTEDKILGITRTMQVYRYVVPRQAMIRAIKGANRPGPGLYWQMKNPIGKYGEGKRKAPENLRGWMVDTHRCNDLLADMILRGVPKQTGRSGGEPPEPEVWLLNADNDDTYNHHMSAVHKTPRRIGGKIIEKWRPVHAGGRWDYRDCEAYQIAAAHMMNVHLLPPAEELVRMRQAEAELQQKQKSETPKTQQRRSEAWTPTPMD